MIYCAWVIVNDLSGIMDFFLTFIGSWIVLIFNLVVVEYLINVPSLITEFLNENPVLFLYIFPPQLHFPHCSLFLIQFSFQFFYFVFILLKGFSFFWYCIIFCMLL